MNKDQRRRLSDALGELHNIKESVSSIGYEEQEKFDNASEGLQGTDKYQKMEENASSLLDIESNLEDCINDLDTVINNVF